MGCIVGVSENDNHAQEREYQREIDVKRDENNEEKKHGGRQRKRAAVMKERTCCEGCARGSDVDGPRTCLLAAA